MPTIMNNQFSNYFSNLDGFLVFSIIKLQLLLVYSFHQGDFSWYFCIYQTLDIYFIVMATMIVPLS